MRNRISEYNFTIKYRKGKELVEADALSRLYEEPEKFTVVEKRSNNILVDNNSVHYWKQNNNEIKEIPQISKRATIIKEIHENIGHRRTESTVYEIKKKYYWPKLPEDVKMVLKKYTSCLKNDQKSEGGSKLVITSSPSEIVGIDLMFIDQKRPVLVAIDYYTRKMEARVLKYKEASDTSTMLQEIFNTMGIPKTVISDNGKEFTNKKWRNCSLIIILYIIHVRLININQMEE